MWKLPLAVYLLAARAAEHTNLTTLVTTWNEALTGAFPDPSLSSFPSQLFDLLSQQGFNATALCPLGPLHLFARNRNILGFSIIADTLTPDDALRCLATRDPSNSTLFHYLAESPAPGLSRVLTRMRHESSDARASLAAALGFTQGFPQWSGDTLSKVALEESAGAPEFLILQKHLDSLPAAAKEVALNSKRAPYGLTPLDTACSHGREAVAAWLAANGGRGTKAGCHLWQPTLGKEEESLVSPLGMQGSHALPPHTLPPSFSLDAHTKVGWRALPPHALKRLGYNSDVLRPSVESPSSPAVTFALPMDELSLGALTPENRRQLEEAYLIEGTKPFIIRGGTNSSQVFDMKTLLRMVGGKDTMLTFGGIPYSSEYNRGGGTITAGDFVSSYMGLRGGDPNNSETTTTPPPLVFDNIVLKGSASGLSVLHQRRRNALFNGAPVGLSQLILGPAGSGSALHYHPAAVNFLVLGLKAWVLVPPSSAGFFDGTAQDWWTRILPNMSIPRVEVLQGPGDMVFVPKNWGHAVINLADSLATAYEALY